MMMIGKWKDKQMEKQVSVEVLEFYSRLGHSWNMQ
jgi:hypothetical protein